MKRGAEAACLREPRRAAWAKNLGAGHRCITPEQADLKKHRGKMMEVWNSCLAQSRGKHLLFPTFISHHIPSSVLQWGRESINHLRPTSTTSIETHRVSMFIKLYHQYSASFTNKSSHAWHTTSLFHSCALWWGSVNSTQVLSDKQATGMCKSKYQNDTYRSSTEIYPESESHVSNMATWLNGGLFPFENDVAWFRCIPLPATVTIRWHLRGRDWSNSTLFWILAKLYQGGMCHRWETKRFAGPSCRFVLGKVKSKCWKQHLKTSQSQVPS